MIGTEDFVTNYYYDTTNPLHPYSYSLPANNGELPPLNALRDAPPVRVGFWACEKDGAWIEIEDHRETEYWLPGEGDTWLTPAREMKELGPMPEGYSLSAPKIDFATALEMKLEEITGAYASAFAPINAMYPAIEREGWAEQEAEAKAVLSDPAVETPVLSILVQLRNQGETVAELAAKVLANAAQWRLVYSYLTGQQQKMYAEVSALDTVDAVLAYAVRYTMPEGF